MDVDYCGGELTDQAVRCWRWFCVVVVVNNNKTVKGAPRPFQLAADTMARYVLPRAAWIIWWPIELNMCAIVCVCLEQQNTTKRAQTKVKMLNLFIAGGSFVRWCFALICWQLNSDRSLCAVDRASTFLTLEHIDSTTPVRGCCSFVSCGFRLVMCHSAGHCCCRVIALIFSACQHSLPLLYMQTYILM